MYEGEDRRVLINEGSIFMGLAISENYIQNVCAS